MTIIEIYPSVNDIFQYAPPGGRFKTENRNMTKIARKPDDTN